MSETITLFEDDLDLRSLMALALAKAGFQVKVISPDDGFSLEETPDLYIIDINFGTINGLDICKKIKASGRQQVPVVIISAHPDLRTLAMEACADDILPKPFTADQLLKKVQQLTQAKFKAE